MNKPAPPPQPNVQLKNIVIAPRLSSRSTAFSAALWVDGRFWGVLSNRGQGGEHIFDPAQNRPHEHLAILADRISAASEGLAPALTLNELVAQILDHHSAKKALATVMAKYVLYYADGLPTAGARAFLQRLKVSWGSPASVQRARVRAEHPRSAILNELPIDQALDVYRLAL